jgi:Protein of unknown function (DUF3015)
MGGTSAVRYVMSAAVLWLALSACTVTETIGNILGSTKEFLSSTTPGDWFTGDGVLKADHKVIAFVAINFDNLKQDMARGRGEYLSSLSELFGIREERREAFFAYAQSRYRLTKDTRGGPEELVALLAPTQS